jgi:hypothetical protein
LNTWLPQRFWLFHIFADASSLSVLQKLFQTFGNAIGPSRGSAVMKDAEKMCAPMRRRHALPLFGGPGVLSKSHLHHGRQLALGFHGFHQALGNLL